jgi:glucose dehydrogenase
MRPGDNRWANSVVALSAQTGELLWGFQLVPSGMWLKCCTADLRRLEVI